MPYPQALLALYPPQGFEEIIEQVQPEQINVYLDMKNAMTSMFVPNVIEEIVFNTKNNGKLDSSIFQSLVMYASWWRRFCLARNLRCSVHIASDYGRSAYHQSIYERYKENRRVSTTKLTPYDEEFQEIKAKNTDLAANVINKIPNAHFYLLSMLEADFVPYYLITRKYNDPKILHIICSNDHDMYEAITQPNIIQLFKCRGVSKILTDSSCIYGFLGIDKQSINSKTKILDKLNEFDPKYLSALMAVIGDSGDDVPGVDGVGPKKALDLFSDMSVIMDLLGTPEEIDDRVAENGLFLKPFDTNKDYGAWNKVLQAKVLRDKKKPELGTYDINELLTNSFKLQSFEQLCRWLERRDTTSKYAWLKYLSDVADKTIHEIIPSSRAFIGAASRLDDNYLTEAMMDAFYQ